MPAFRSWLSAFRLRTLPLALSTIAMGSFLAGAEKRFSWPVFSLAIVTTLFLQILSNLANDYGDTFHGADSGERIGPQRAVQSGAITADAMKRAMMLFGMLALISGIGLIYISLQTLSFFYPLLFFMLGLGAISAAVKYTAGKNPYGYKGLGDIFVFLFFGLVGVGGTYFLHTHNLKPLIFLPAAAVGFFSAGVLNVNNMRDRISDAKAGKNTLAVRLGANGSKKYHLIIISLGWLCSLLFSIINFSSPLQLLYLLSLPLFIVHLARVLKNKEAKLLDAQLKFLVLATLFYCTTFGISQLLQ